MADQRIGGEGGIRTPGTVPRTLDFEDHRHPTPSSTILNYPHT